MVFPIRRFAILYQITELREDTVQLLPTGMSYPIFRAESRERFEQLLQNDLRNGPVTEFLYVDPEKADKDLRKVLTSGLFTIPLLKTGMMNAALKKQRRFSAGNM